MKRHFGLLLAALFLAVQVLSTLHMAEHGFVGHKHYGQSCSIQSFYEQGKTADTPPTPFATPDGFHLKATMLFKGSMPGLHAFLLAQPRAPPVIL